MCILQIRLEHAHADLRAAAKLKMANTIYSYVLVPLVKNAQYFLVLAFANDTSNASFSPSLLMKCHQYIWQVGQLGQRCGRSGSDRVMPAMYVPVDQSSLVGVR